MRWALNELIELKRIGRYLPMKRLVNHFNRPRSSIVKKLKELGIERQAKANLWTIEETIKLKVILERFSTLSHKAIQKQFFPKRSLESVNNKIKRLQR